MLVLLYDCSNFTTLAVTERWKWVKKEKRCFKCLRAGHDQKSCSFLRCTTDKKNRPHHSLLHQPSLSVRDQKQRNSKSNAPVITIEDKRSKWLYDSVYLKVIPIIVQGPKDKCRILALLDEGSAVSLIDRTIAGKIGLKSVSSTITLSGLNDTPSEIKILGVADCSVSSLVGAEFYSLRGVYVVGNLKFYLQEK